MVTRVAIEESDESLYWLEILDELMMGEYSERKRLLKEANEITAILVKCRASM